MALKLQFADNTQVEYLSALETEEYWNGSNRRTLTFELARSTVNLETLDALVTAENCATLHLVNTQTGVTNISDGYVLKLKLAVEPVLTGQEPPAYEERVLLKLGKRTYIEQQLARLGL